MPRRGWQGSSVMTSSLGTSPVPSQVGHLSPSLHAPMPMQVGHFFILKTAIFHASIFRRGVYVLFCAQAEKSSKPRVKLREGLQTQGPRNGDEQADRAVSLGRDPIHVWSFGNIL